MEHWGKKMFVERADLFVNVMNQRWSRTESLVDGMIKLLKDFDIERGRVLDLCCGNGRVSTTFAKKGFTAVGVDISPTFIKDAVAKAKHFGVSERVRFIQGDVRKLLTIVPDIEQFDLVVNVWTSIGLFDKGDDLSVFRQARQLTREGAALFVAETMHRDFLNLRFCPSSFTQYEDMVLVENPTWNALTSKLSNTWSFYRKEGEDLKFVDKVGFDIYVYSASELVSLLKEAGWETIAAYGNLTTQQPFNSWTTMHLVTRTLRKE